MSETPRKQIDLIEAFERATGRKYRPVTQPRHPATGCPCTDCTTRDDRLESLAEERASRDY